MQVKIEPVTGAKRKRSTGGASGSSQPTRPTRRSKMAVRMSCAELAEDRGRRRSNTWSPRRESTRTLREARSATRSPAPRSPRSERDPAPSRWRPVGTRRPTPHPENRGAGQAGAALWDPVEPPFLEESAMAGDTTVTSSQLPDLVEMTPSPLEGLPEPRARNPPLPRGKFERN